MALTKQPDRTLANPPNFSRDFKHREKPCIGVFGPGYAGKTRFCVTAGEWAEEHGKVPGWIILDRKSRQTIESTCIEMGLPTPLMNTSDFITSREALRLAATDDEATTMAVYKKAFDAVTESICALADLDHVEPIIVDPGTELWDWIGYARLGRREGVKSRYWGPSKRDWKEFFDALKAKTVLITFWARDEYRDDKRTGRTTLDGPPHVSYTTTTVVRLVKHERKEDLDERYKLDIVESLDNNGLEGVDEILTGSDITFKNLMSRLNPGDE